MLDALKISVTQKLNPVHQAKTFVELEAIWCYRYKVCVNELSLHDLPALDHDNGWLRLESDEFDSTSVYYTGPIEDVTGSIVIRTFQPGEVPEDIYKELSLELFDDIKNKKIVQMSSYSFSQTLNGKTAAHALAYKAFEEAVERKGDLLLVSCLADHLQLYQDLGLRPYGAKNLSKDTMGLHVPLLGLLDLKYYEDMHSPVYHILKRMADEGYVHSTETGPLLELIYEASASAEVNPDVIKNEILLFFEESIREQGFTSNFLSFLPEHLLHRISESSLLVNFQAEEDVIQQDVRDQEFYFIMEGALEVRRDEQVLVTKRKGEIFGEVGFFRENGKRSASVVSIESTRLLVIRKSFLTNLVKKNPADACIFYDALARIMAENIAKS